MFSSYRFIFTPILILVFFTWGRMSTTRAQIWEDVNVPSPSVNLVFVSGTSLFALANPGELLISTDNGTSWTSNLLEKGYFFYSIPWVSDSSNIFALGYEHLPDTPVLFKSIDGGVSWKVLQKFSSYLNFEYFFNFSDTLVIQSDENNFMISVDTGKSWVRHTIPSGFVMIGRLMVITSELVSSDFGDTWEKLIFFTTPNDSCSLNLVSGDNYFFCTPGSISYLYYTSDSGRDWNKCFGLPAGIHNLKSFDNGHLLLDVDEFSITNGLYASTDSGRNWGRVGYYFFNATNALSGSQYYFVQGPNKLWRLSKSSSSYIRNNPCMPLSIHCSCDPSASSTRISYSISSHSEILLEAFDIMGRSVARILSGAQDAGDHELSWDTSSLPAGSYIIRLTADGGSASKVVVVK